MAGLVLGLAFAPAAVPLLTGQPGPDRLARAVRADLPAAADPLARFYRARRFAPLWIAAGRLRPEARRLVSILDRAGDDDLDPAKYHPAALADLVDAAEADPQPARLAAAEVALSRALAAYAGDLHRPAPAARMAWVDPAASLPPADPAAILDQAARAPSLSAAVTAAQRMNPIYVSLRRELARRRGGPDEALIAANLERARALPPDLGKRYLVVDPAAQTLWFYSGGAARGSMRVIVGSTDNATPSMIGVMRYALFNPYWNVPPDLVRNEIAPAVLRRGYAYLAGKHLQALADFSPDAATLAPTAIDWRQVASGAEVLRLRQRPGPSNMMGQVKFMLPNPLGIYLHDTPAKGLFSAAIRTDSHGCVRLEHARRLAEWLWGRAPRPPAGGDARLDLDAPVPVYILYLTALPGPRGLTHMPDVYGRDLPLETQIAAREGAGPRPQVELLSWSAERPAFPY